MKLSFLSFWVSAATLALTVSSASAGGFKGPVGLQLYSLRDQFAKDVPGTLQVAEDLGFKEVELAGTYGQTPEQFSRALKAHKLKAIAGHFPYERFRDDVEGVAREAKALGLSYAGCAWIPHENPFDQRQCLAAAAVFNRAGAALAKHGIKFYYHVHGYEFQPYKDGTLFDLLMAETKPSLVSYEMDILWVVFPGQDPVKLFEKYGQRWQLVHLKDLKQGVPTGALTGSTDVRNDVALGTGQMNFPAILQAAQRAGVKHYFIEDESPSALTQLPQSLKYIKSVRW